MKRYINSTTDTYTTLKRKINEAKIQSDLEKADDEVLDAYHKDLIAKGDFNELMHLIDDMRFEIMYGYQDEWEDDEEPYRPSASRRDYSPSSPWNAPGMSVSDFI